MTSSAKKRGGKTAIKFMPECTIPKLLTYNNLVKEMKKIDIGVVESVTEVFPTYLDDENISGCFRDLRAYLPRLGTFYLNMQTRRDALKWFGKTEGTFLVSFRGDGCPFGKNETASSFLVIFLNTGKTDCFQ